MMSAINGLVMLAFVVATFAVLVDWLGDWS